MAGRHALHDPRAIQIDGLDADAQLLGNFPIGITLHQREQYITLAWRELLQPRLHPRRSFTEALAMVGLAQGLQDTVQQQLFVVGFLDKSCAPALNARTTIGTSAWPLTKITGRCRSRLRMCSCTFRPPMPGMRTPSSTQALRRLSQASRNSRPLVNGSALRPTDSSNQTVESSIPWSSSTTYTTCSVTLTIA